MTKQKMSKWRNVAIGAVLGLATLLPLPNSFAEEKSPEPVTGYNLRIKKENTLNENTNLFKSTLGIAKCNEDRSVGEEFFRLYDYTDKNGRENIDWTSVGFKIPSFKLGDLENKATIFGSFGDKEGLGLESTHNLKDLTFVLGAEKSFESPLSIDSTKFGLGVDYHVKKWTFGGNINVVKTEEERKNYFLFKTIFDATKNDQIGAGFRLSDLKDFTENSISSFWCHYGKDQKWGTRNYIKYDWNNDDSKKKSLSFESILAQNPTFSKFSSPWIVGGNRGEMYDNGIIENALGPERTPIGNRSNGGLIGSLSGNYTESFREETGFLKGKGGYKFALGNSNMNITPTVFYEVGLNNNKIDKYGGSVLLNMGKILRGNLMLEGTTSKDSDGKTDNYTGIQYSLKF